MKNLSLYEGPIKFKIMILLNHWNRGSCAIGPACQAYPREPNRCVVARDCVLLSLSRT